MSVFWQAIWQTGLGILGLCAMALCIYALMIGLAWLNVRIEQWRLR